MNTNRRNFLKLAAAGAASALGVSPVQARPPRELAPNAVGILYDATLCVGCKACEVACKQANDLPASTDTPVTRALEVVGAWDADDDLNGHAMNKIKAYPGDDPRLGTRKHGCCFVKRACMHCVDPNCVSACPVSALTKDPDTGIVRYNPDACIGCRYCQLACPFNIPKFEFDKAFPRIVKCQLCAPRLAAGKIPACCEACPTGASLFGRVEDLRAEAHRRLGFTPGSRQEYPVHQLGGDTHRVATARAYQPHLYGETEAGGTQYLLLADVPFTKLGLPALGPESQARVAETLQHTLYQGMVAPGLLLGGLVYAVYRHTHDEHANDTEGRGDDD